MIITRFSYRFPGRRPAGGERLHDPLKPSNLEHRLRLLEIGPLPSLVGQSEQDFAWVIVIDRQLDPSYHARLTALVESRPRTFLHEFDPSDDLSDPAWLAPYLRPMESGDYLVTTNLDDDDALPRNFVGEVKRVVAERAAAGVPLFMLGATDAVEWDLSLTADRPLGSVAPWHRVASGDSHVTSVGFSLAARQPDYPFTALSKNHVLAREYLDFSVPPADPGVERNRERFLRAARSAGDELVERPPEDGFVDLSPALRAPVLVTNHIRNMQTDRLYEPKHGASAVLGPKSFPEFDLGWDALERSATAFRAGVGDRLLQRTWRGRAWLRRRRVRLERLERALRGRVRRRLARLKRLAK